MPNKYTFALALVLAGAGSLAQDAGQPVEAGLRFAVSAAANEVTDRMTNLVWRRCPEGMKASASGCGGTALAISFDAALLHAGKAAAAGWRLPSAAELAGIADENRFTMAIDTSAFPGTPAEHFWTSSRQNSDYVRAVNFYNGFVYSRYHTSAHYLRLVRNPK